MSISGRFYPKAPVDIQVSCYGWNKETQSDELLQQIDLVFWLPIRGSTGKEFTYTCKEPEELWFTLRRITKDPLAFFKENFNYTPPAGGVSSLPVNLNDLF